MREKYTATRKKRKKKKKTNRKTPAKTFITTINVRAIGSQFSKEVKDRLRRKSASPLMVQRLFLND